MKNIDSTETAEENRVGLTASNRANFITAEEVATRLNVHVNTVRNRTRRGILPVIKRAGMRPAYHWPSIETTMMRMQSLNIAA